VKRRANHRRSYRDGGAEDADGPLSAKEFNIPPARKNKIAVTKISGKDD
jgi:hypothetical protein